MQTLTVRQRIALKFISKKEGKMLPAGSELPTAVKELEKLGLIAKDGPELVGIEGESKLAWILTDAGKKMLAKA